MTVTLKGFVDEERRCSLGSCCLQSQTDLTPCISGLSDPFQEDSRLEHASVHTVAESSLMLCDLTV